MITPRARKLVWQTLAIVVFYFLAIAPTLPWPQISADSEVLVAQTVLQMRHGGPWWLPMLGDAPRTNKPPLPAWITAIATRPNTVSRLSSVDPLQRESAYQTLAFEMRWPALAAGCIALLAVAWMARIIGGARYVLPSVIICGSTFLFIRFIRIASTDVYLLAFVSLANVFLASAIFDRRQWLGFIGAGVALGLALMSKGPPALAFTLAPLVAILAFRRDRLRSLKWLPMGVGLLIILAIALPWPLSVIHMLPSVTSNWKYQMQGGGSADVSHDKWYAYISLFPNLLPWLPIVLVGMLLAAMRLRRCNKITMCLAMVVLPIIIFSFFPLRKERYLLPITGPAAILAAHAILLMGRTIRKYQPITGTIWLIHWIIVAVIAVGLPFAEATYLKRMDGTHWLSIPIAIVGGVTSILLIVLGWRESQRNSLLSLFATFAVMLLANTLFLFGWSGSASGVSEMKLLADKLHYAFPNREIVYFKPPGGDKPVTLDLDIYLDRPVPVRGDPSPTDGSVAAVVTLRYPNTPEPTIAGWQAWGSPIVTEKHHYTWYLFVPAE